MTRSTVFVCDAEPAAVAGLRWYLSGVPEFELVGTAESESAASPQVEALKPNVLILDHGAGLRAGIRFISELRFLSPETSTLLWTREVPDLELVRAFQAGARGHLRKSSPLSSLLQALERLSRGEVFLEETASPALRQWTARRNAPRLTPREREIIDLVAQGLKNREIAERLQITTGTVKVHLMHVFEKTGARHRYELALAGGKLGVTEEVTHNLAEIVA